MNEIASKCQAFMNCTYNDPADYITPQWLKDSTNLITIIKLLQFSIADDLKALARDCYYGMERVGIESNIDFDFALLKQLKIIADNLIEV